VLSLQVITFPLLQKMLPSENIYPQHLQTRHKLHQPYLDFNVHVTTSSICMSHRHIRDVGVCSWLPTDRTVEGRTESTMTWLHDEYWHAREAEAVTTLQHTPLATHIYTHIHWTHIYIAAHIYLWQLQTRDPLKCIVPLSSQPARAATVAKKINDADEHQVKCTQKTMKRCSDNIAWSTRMHKAGNALTNSDKLLQKTQIYFSQFCISKNSEERLTDMMASSKRQKLPTLVPRFWLHTGHGSGFSPDSKLSRAYNQYT